MLTLSRLRPSRALAFCLGALATVSLATSALAHSVWIEDLPEGKLVVRFGEPLGEPEKSPGYLDQLTAVTAWTVADAKPKAFTVSKQSDHFLIEQAKPTEAVQAETAFPVRKSGDKPARKPIFYTRWQPGGLTTGTPALTLDLVPTGQPGEVKVFFRGQPLPNVKLTLHAPKRGDSDVPVDAQGVAKLGELKETGLYLLTCAGHSENTPGFSGGAPYEIASHNASLAWRQGGTPAPAVPAAK